THFYSTASLLGSPSLLNLGISPNEDFTNQTVYPIIDYDYYVKPPILGGELSFNSNVMALSNEDGLNSDRLIVQTKWQRQMIDGIGQVYTPFVQLRGDLYDVNGVTNGLNSTEELVDQGPSNGFVDRGEAVAGFEYRYPFIATTGSVTHVFEPIGQIIARPSSVGDQQNIPNEDALSL